MYCADTGGTEDEKISLLQLVFCGNNRHPRKNCQAGEAFCNKCEKKGHFRKVCQS